MKRTLILVAAAIVAILASVLAFQHAWEPGSEQREVHRPDRDEQIRQGAYLARAGNCMACHTAVDGAAYAGGKPLTTPFGTLFAPNLTPEAATGIGQWTSDDFWRAMHNGKSKDGSFLYPAFPYSNYTKMPRADSDALYAYFRSIAPVRQRNREHALNFPYNQRPLLAFWRTLYFRPGEFQPQLEKGAEWNRGAYLVQGPGHCSACHAPRNALGASLGEERLGGATMGDYGWYALPLGGIRDVFELTELLQDGVSKHSSVSGPMAEVVSGSLQYLAPSDIRAMSSYLVTLPEADPAPSARPRERQAAAAVLRQGGKVYEKHCVTCHGEQGDGIPRVYPRLVAKPTANSGNAIRMVLYGGYAPSTKGNSRPYGMPPFRGVLTDAEVAAVLTFVNTSWGNQGSLVPVYQVEQFRQRD